MTRTAQPIRTTLHVNSKIQNLRRSAKMILPPGKRSRAASAGKPLTLPNRMVGKLRGKRWQNIRQTVARPRRIVKNRKLTQQNRDRTPVKRPVIGNQTQMPALIPHTNRKTPQPHVTRQVERIEV
ncbi:hypothetical protein SAMN05880590_12519 [Rhizobium sp. RU35A]|nr:hypothetical protein SAMN05880590_12519 [Rhizobium sp. RU35A]